jgi:hypothetical protein
MLSKRPSHHRSLPRFSRSRTRHAVLESLEPRRLMATFGNAWPEPRSLSVSFPTDQAAIGAYRNVARESLDQVADRLEWQEATLRAFQTWAVQANLNIGLVPDRGDDFGAVGLSSNDPRFGEFRIGAFPQGAVLANASPYQVNAGTWSGDVLINSDVDYFLADWKSNGPIQVPMVDNKPAVEFFSVLLHEAGNALGIADNSISGSVMNGTYSGPNGTLKSTDIASIRQLYGARQDVHESGGNNNSRGRASFISTPTGHSGTAPIVTHGSLNSLSDVDFYRFQPLPGKEKVTVRLVASGVSLVKAQIEVLDRFGNKIADAKAESVFNNNLQIEVGSLRDLGTLFVRVARNTNDVFAIGDYRLELDYRDPSLQPSVIPPIFDADAHDEDHASLEYISVDSLFSQAGIVDQEFGTNDTLSTASRLETTRGYLPNTRYELQASIATLGDRDLWSFRSPLIPSPVLHVSVDPVGVDAANLEVVLMTSEGTRVAAKATRKPDGGLSLEVQNPSANTDYVLFVRTTRGASVPAGNYVASISFASNAANLMRQVFAGSLQAGAEDFSNLKVNKTQLMRFDLSSISNVGTTGVQMSIHDARTGDIVAAFSAASNNVKSEYVWIGAGEYIIRTRNIQQTGTIGASTSFTLKADVLSDDQGPRPIDPNNPLPTITDWNWEENPSSDPPVVVQPVEPPFLPPWFSDILVELVNNYYRDFLA